MLDALIQKELEYRRGERFLEGQRARWEAKKTKGMDKKLAYDLRRAIILNDYQSILDLVTQRSRENREKAQRSAHYLLDSPFAREVLGVEREEKLQEIVELQPTPGQIVYDLMNEGREYATRVVERGIRGTYHTLSSLSSLVGKTLWRKKLSEEEWFKRGEDSSYLSRLDN